MALRNQVCYVNFASGGIFYRVSFDFSARKHQQFQWIAAEMVQLWRQTSLSAGLQSGCRWDLQIPSDPSPRKVAIS
jgi:hypothetical protein